MPRARLKYVLPTVALMIAAGVSFVMVNQAGGSAPPPYLSYAVKFVCGEYGKLIPGSAADVPEGPVKPGDYQTAINIHNPSAGQSIAFVKKGVLLYAGTKPVRQTTFEVQKPPRNQVNAGLGADFGMLIDCQDIRAQLLKTATSGAPPAPTFIEGFVIIQEPPGPAQAPPPLDVTVLYTSHGYNCTPPVGSTTCTAKSVTREGFSQDLVTVTPTQVTQ